MTLLGEPFCDQGWIDGESDGKDMHWYFPLLDIVDNWSGGAVCWNNAALRGLASYHCRCIDDDLGVDTKLKERDEDAYYDCW